MIGRVRHLREKGRGTSEIECFHGLALLTVTFYQPDGLRQKAVERRLRQLHRTFQKMGVSRVILPPEFPYTGYFTAVKPVDTLNFYRGTADLLVLGQLGKRGILPSSARVALTAPRLCPELKEAARRLCRQVRELRIDVPGEEGARFAQELQRSCGLPVMPRTLPIDVTAAFGPSEEAADLRLWGDEPCLGGLCLRAEGVDLPDDLEQPLLALLWEQGRLKREQIRTGNAP